MRGRGLYVGLALLVVLALVASACGPQQAAGKPIKFGHIGVSTGPMAEFGEDIRHGIDLAVEEVNQAGGINGRPIEVVFEDDGADPPKAAVAAAKFAADPEIVGIIGPTMTATFAAVADILDKNKIPAVSTFATLDSLFNGQCKYCFTTGFLNTWQVKYMVPEALKRGDKIALLHDTTAWGMEAKDIFISDLKAKGKDPVAVIPYEVRQADYTPQILAAQRAGANVIQHFGVGPDFVIAARNIQQLNYKVAIMGNIGLGTRATVNLGKDAVEGVFHPDGIDYSKPAAQALRDKMKARYGVDYDTFVPMTSYDIVKILVNAVKKVGPDREKVRQAIEETTGFETIAGKSGTKANFSKDKHAAFTAEDQVMKVIKGGVRVNVN